MKATEDQKKWLVENYMLASKRQIEKKFPDCTYTEVIIYGKSLGLKRAARRPWTTYELDFVKDNYNKIGEYEVADHLDRTPDSVKAKAYALGIVQFYDKDFDTSVSLKQRLEMLKNKLNHLDKEMDKAIAEDDTAKYLAIRGDFDHIRIVYQSVESRIANKKNKFSDNYIHEQSIN